MATSVNLNGVIYSIPQTGEEAWGSDLSSYFIAIPQAVLQKSGGNFTLTANVNFGANFGLLSQYYTTRTSNAATAGQFRLARADVISWRNQANAANLDLGVNSSNQLTFGGSAIYPQGITALTGQVTATGPGSVAATISAGVIVNSMLSASAAIDFSKLAALTSGNILVGNVSNVAASVAVSGDATLSNAGVLTIGAGAIDNSKISASAAIAFSKLATLSSANILVGNVSNVAASVAVTGDITISNAGVTAIGSNKVTLGMMAQVSTQTFLGRTTASTGNVESLTATQSTAILNAFVGDSGSGGTKGMVPAPAAGDTASGKYLGAAGTWSTPPATATSPVGSVIMFGGASAPTGWLLCDGSAVSRTTYSDLFSIISTTYGVGDGSTTFNLPNTQGVFIRGAGSQTISGTSYSGTRGTSQRDQMQGHYHNLNDPSHTHANPTTALSLTGGANNTPNNVDNASPRVNTFSATTGITILQPTDDGSNGTPRVGTETRPANIVFNFIIKT